MRVTRLNRQCVGFGVSHTYHMVLTQMCAADPRDCNEVLPGDCDHQVCVHAWRFVGLQVMLGASAVLSNGTVLSRAGSAAVAMTAHASSKPVLVCCEAFKVGVT
jgi:hypothetical protein